MPVGSCEQDESVEAVRDLAGNLREWVADGYHDSYDGHPGDESVWGSECADSRVVRGGGSDSPGWATRAATRSGEFFAGGGYPGVGFRCARAAP